MKWMTVNNRSYNAVWHSSDRRNPFAFGQELVGLFQESLLNGLGSLRGLCARSHDVTPWRVSSGG